MSKRLKSMIKSENSERISASNFKIQRDRNCWSNFEMEGNRKINSTLDWTQLPYDTVIQLFSLLNYRDRASLSSVCPSWRSLAASACLWRSLDLRLFDFGIAMANSLASRCSSLQKLYFQGVESAEAINNLNARNLIELTGNYCQSVTDVILTRIVDRHVLLENIQLGPEFCTQLGSRGINSIARCCPNLKKLWISGVKGVNADALNALARNCKLLVDLSFTDCEKLDEKALSKFVSVQFLSVAGVRQLDSDLVIEHWINFPNLLALDVSRTDVSPAAVAKLLWSSPTLKVICALNCTAMEQHNFSLRSDRGIELISILTYIPKLLESQDPMIMPWIEQVLSRSFLRLSKVRPNEMQEFWANQGATLFINLLQSSQEDVQERTVRGIERLLREGREDDTLESLTEAFVNQGGVTRISNLGKSSNQGVLFQLAKVLPTLFLNYDHITNAAVNEGGIQLLMNLLESVNRIIVEVACETLMILDMDMDDQKSIMLECGYLKVLISLLYRRINKIVLVNVISILKCMASDEKCGIEIIKKGGLKALIALTQEWNTYSQIASTIDRLTRYGEMNIIVEQEPGLLQVLVQFIRSPSRGEYSSGREGAVAALWNLSMDVRNCESIVAANSIEALIFLANSTSSDSWRKWKSASEVEKLNNIFGSAYEDEVHVSIIGVIWNLTFMPDFALRVVDAKGVQTLIRISLVSRLELARFLAVLVIANIFHVIPEGCKHKKRTLSNLPPKILMRQMKHIDEFIDKFLNNKTYNSACSSDLTINDLDQIQEYARIEYVHQMECSGAEIARMVNMLNSSFLSIKSCAAFALMQFTAPGNKNTKHHISLLKEEETLTILRSTAECSTAPFAAVTFSKIVLRNLEYHF